MDGFEEVPPETLPVTLTEDGVVVEYADGREVFYRGVPARAESPYHTVPGKDSHVLVTDAAGSSGVLLYVNERRTDGEILEGTGVGRVLLDRGETTTLFPGISIECTGMREEIRVDPDLEGRVFVFEEDQFEERSYELVPAEDGD